ncbi:MAG: endonuclease/exonuclease/phosphatase family protein [Planctomycetales bacterium]|nr:endonuclease/exonuclease/phosphatase family protein [Planctomycetales bacterium]
MIRFLHHSFWRALCLAIIAATILGFLSRYSHWLFYADQPRLHYAIVGAIACFACFQIRSWIIAAVGCLCVLLNLALALPTMAVALQPASNHAAEWSVLHAHVDQRGQLDAKLLQHIKEAKPDVILLQEVTAEFLTNESELDDLQYERIVSEPRDHTRGVAAWVRTDLSGRITATVCDLATADRPMVQLTVGNQLRMLHFHAKRPVNSETYQTQLAEFAALSAWLRESDLPTVVLGDFNAAPWSEQVRRMAQQNGCRAFGFPTWPSQAYGAGLPIDFVLASSKTKVVRVNTILANALNRQAILVTISHATTE